MRPNYDTHESFHPDGGRHLDIIARKPGETWGRLDLAVLLHSEQALRTGRTEIKCAGRSVLAYAGVLHPTRGCRTEQSCDLFQNNMAEHLPSCVKILLSLDFSRITPKCPVLHD